MMTERAKQLGIVGPHTLYGSDARDLMFRASPALASGPSLLLSNNMQPENFSNTLIAVLALCHAPNVQIAEFNALAKSAKRWGWIDKPLYRVRGIGPATLTPRDSLDLYWAFLRAAHRGVDARVRSRTDLVLARHPQGDANRSDVLSRIQSVVRAGERHERQVAARLGLSEPALVARATLLKAGSSKGLHLANPLCKALVDGQASALSSALDRYAAAILRTNLDRRNDALDAVGRAIGPVAYAQCFVRGRALPLSAEQLRAFIAKASKRLHPDSLKDKGCLKRGADLKRDAAKSALLGPLLARLQDLRIRRCLIP